MEIKTASLYEMNQQLSANEPKMGIAARKKAQELARLWFRDSIQKYAMLLCHDRRDYTLFQVVNSPADAAAALFDCINNRGELISIEKNSDDALEIWIRILVYKNTDEKIIRTEPQDYCYYLFNYDLGVIEC